VLTYTVTRGNWIHQHSPTDRTPLVSLFPSGELTIDEIVGVHGFVFEQGTAKQHESNQLAAIGEGLSATGWEVKFAQDLHLPSGGKRISDFDLVAVKGLVMLVVESKTGTQADLGELAKTVRRGRLGGGTQSLAIMISKTALEPTSVAARFPLGRAASFAHGQHDALVTWANDRV
jgi:hypothetical protein